VRSANEAAWLLLQYDLLLTPANMGFKYDIKLPQGNTWRCNQTSLTADVQDFLARPPALHDHNISSFYHTFHTVPASQGSINSPLCQGTTSDGKLIYLNNHPRGNKHTFVSFPNLSPEDGELYHFAQLLMHTSPTSLASLISPNNITKTYMEECVLQGLYTSDEQLMEHHAQTHQHDWYQGALDMALDFVTMEQPILNLQRSVNDPHPPPNPSNATADQLPDRAAAYKAATVHRTPENAKSLHDLVEAVCKRSYVRPCDNATFEAMEAKMLNSSLPNSDQLAVVNVCFGPDEQMPVLKVTGGGGNGKSMLLQYLVHRYARDGKLVIATATTAKAADRLEIPGATTVHRAFGLGRGSFTPCTNSNLATYIDLADVIIIVESSMATAALLAAVNDRCLECDTAESLKLFAGKTVIIAGDPHQLPAVCPRCKDNDKTLCPHQPYNIVPINWQHWPDLPEFDLHLNKRHSDDKDYGQCMAHMRRQPLTQQHLAYLEANTTLIDDESALQQDFDKDTRILCATNELVDKFNLVQLQRHHGEANITTVTATHEFKRCYGLTADDQQKAISRMDHTSDLRSSMALAVGCPVTITRNIMPQKRLYNGTPGTITAVSADMIYVAVKHLPDPVPIRRHQAAYSLPGGGVLLRKMFPLKCAYAQTVHNVQGDTITGRVVIHLQGFAGHQGLAYVACSRATHAKNVTFILPPHTSKLLPDFFTPHIPPTQT